MNIVTHILKKDIRRERVLLAVWLLLLVLQFVLIGSSINPGDLLMQAVYRVLSVLVPLFQALVLIVVIPHMIQEEPLVGTTAFWFTRPISRGTLLKSKTLFALLVLALPPLVAEIIVLAANGATGHDLCLAAPEIVMEQLAFIVCVAILAVITPNFGRFAVLGAVVLVAMILLLYGVQLSRLYFRPERYIDPATRFSLTKSRGVAGEVLMIVVAGTLIAHQYLTRKTTRTIAGAVIGVALVLTAQSFWPWDFLKPKPLPGNDPNFDAGALKVSLIGKITTSDVVTLRGQEAPSKNIMARVQMVGIPKGYVVQDQGVDPHLVLPGGTALDMIPAGAKLSLYAGNQPDNDALESALGGTPIVNAHGYSFNNNGDEISLFTLDSNTYNKYAAVPLKFSARVDFIAFKYVLTAEMPLAKGSRYDHGSEHVVITDVLNEPGGVDILLRERNLNLLFDIKNNRRDRGLVVYLLLNKKRGEAVAVKQYSSTSFNVQTGLSSQRLVNRPVRLSFGPVQNRTEMAPPLTPEWLADATLERLELTPVAEFSKELTVDKLMMNGAGPSLGREHYQQTGADPDALAKIKLPQNATREQVRDYVDAVMVASRRQSTWSNSDPQIEMLDEVGSENLDVLIDYASRMPQGWPKSLYFFGAIKSLTRPEDKALILQALPDNHYLVDLVIKYGWQADARDTLESALAQEEGALPLVWIKAVASLQDPSTYDDLKWYLVNRGNNRRETFDAIKQLPGLDLSDTVDEMWQKAKYGPSFQAADACAIAAEYGHADAVETAASILKANRKEDNPKRAREVITKFTPATGDDAALVAWVEANHGKLVFDKQSGKFLPQQ
jgi:ABC-type transport system involved in multi-copper enzyme maturation permease subunit